MQDLKEVTGKVRRVSETQFSPRQHTKGLALLASDADSGLHCLMEPQQLELILKLADICLDKDVSTGVLVSENVSALQRKLWATVCSFVHDAAWQKKACFNAVMTRTISGYQPISTLCGQDDQNQHRCNLNFRHVALAYQQYSANQIFLLKNQQERSCRLKACTKIVGAVVSEVMNAYMDDMPPVPADLVKWCQDAANSTPSGVLAFSQWAQTLDHVSHRNADSHPFESKLNLPVSIEAVCDLLEKVVKLRPSLVQGSENVCKLGLIINRMAAKNQTDQINKVSKSGPESVQSALDITDSSDDEQ